MTSQEFCTSGYQDGMAFEQADDVRAEITLCSMHLREFFSFSFNFRNLDHVPRWREVLVQSPVRSDGV